MSQTDVLGRSCDPNIETIDIQEHLWWWQDGAEHNGSTREYSKSNELLRIGIKSKIITQNCGSILNNENAEIICNICNKFSATNNKSLAAHQRACKRNIKNDTIKIN